MDDHNLIIGATVIAGALLTDAEAAGLPMPYSVHTSDYAPVSLLIRPEDLDAWVKFLGTAPWSNDKPRRGNVHTHLDATVDGVAVRVTALVPVEVAG